MDNSSEDSSNVETDDEEFIPTAEMVDSDDSNPDPHANDDEHMDVQKNPFIEIHVQNDAELGLEELLAKYGHKDTETVISKVNLDIDKPSTSSHFEKSDTENSNEENESSSSENEANSNAEEGYRFLDVDDCQAMIVEDGEPVASEDNVLWEPIGLEDINKETFDLEDSASAEKYRQEFDEALKIVRKKRKKRGPGKKRSLPPDLVGLVGEANLCFARGDHNDAITMCMEVIRLAPTAPEPFQTLGMFYEDMNDMEKAYHYHLISAYLCPNDGDNWIKVAEMADNQLQYKQAIFCYNKAIKMFPDDMRLHLERCKLYEKIGEQDKALDAYERLLRILKPDEGEYATQLAKEIAKIYFSNQKYEAGIKIMETVLKNHSSFITSEYINTYIELLIANKMYHKALLVFQTYCAVTVEADGKNIEANCFTEDFIMVNYSKLNVHISYSNIFPIDLRSKLIVCLIHLKCLRSVEEHMQVIMSEDVENVGDLYLDIADAYIEMKIYAKAETLLVPVVVVELYNIPVVWLKYARCLKELAKNNRAIDAYYHIISLSSNHNEARRECADLLVQEGRTLDAIKIATQCESNQVNLDLLLMKAKLLYEQHFYKDFVSEAKLLLTSDMIYLKHPKEMSVMISSHTHRTRLENLRDIHKELHIIDNYSRQDFEGKEIPAEDLLDIYFKLCHVLLDKMHDYDELTKIVFSAYTSKSLDNFLPNLDFCSLMCMYAIRNTTYCYPLVKSIAVRNLNNNQIWNMFCVVVMRFFQDLRHNRFCLRLFVKNPEIIPLGYFNGHNAMMSGSYKHAIAEYVNIFRQNPKNPFAAFCVSLGFLHIACQKFTSNRHSVVVQLCGFLNIYMDLRGDCQEAFYNVARAFHQLGLLSNAVNFYKRALNCPPLKTEDGKSTFDLRREISYNLSLIYQSSGNQELALYYLRKYFVV